MRLIALCFLVLSACAADPGGSVIIPVDSGSAIADGTRVEPSAPIAHQTVAVLQYSVKEKGFTGAVCSGTLIAKNLVLTAAHCVTTVGRKPKALSKDVRIVVAFGDVDMKGVQPQLVGADEIQVHPKYAGFGKDGEYDRDYKLYDMALLKLEDEAPATFEPATLLGDASWLKKDTTVVIAGYGPELGKDGAFLLRSTDMKIVSDLSSESGQILTNYKQLRGSTRGDSGGPAFLKVRGEVYVWGVCSNGGAEQVEIEGDVFPFYIETSYESVPQHAKWIEATAKTFGASLKFASP